MRRSTRLSVAHARGLNQNTPRDATSAPPSALAGALDPVCTHAACLAMDAATLARIREDRTTTRLALDAYHLAAELHATYEYLAAMYAGDTGESRVRAWPAA